MSAIHDRRQGERGLTLVELLVTMVLFGVVSAICVAAFLSGSETVGRIDDDARGQGDQRIVAQRLSRDLREARGIDTPAVGVDPKGQLTVWIDANANYVKDVGEIVTWKLASTANPDGHYDVARSTNGGKSVIVGRALVSSIAFSYRNDSISTSPLPDASVDKANVVLVSTKYDAIVNNYLQTRQTTFETRLRNIQ